MLSKIKEIKKTAITKVNYQQTFMMVLIVYIAPILIDYLNFFKHAQIKWVNQSLEINEYHSGLSFTLVFIVPFILNYWVKAYYLYVNECEDYLLNANRFIHSLDFKEWAQYLCKILIITIYMILHLCLLVVPGIIKICELIFVPYIIIKDKDLKIAAIINKSKKLSDGHRLEIFCLLMSFLPALILSFLSFGLFAFLFVPYYHFSILELYNKYSKQKML